MRLYSPLSLPVLLLSLLLLLLSPRPVPAPPPPPVSARSQQFAHYDQVGKPRDYALSESGDGAGSIDADFRVRTIDMGLYWSGQEQERELFTQQLGEAMKVTLPSSASFCFPSSTCVCCKLFKKESDKQKRKEEERRTVHSQDSWWCIMELLIASIVGDRLCCLDQSWCSNVCARRSGTKCDWNVWDITSRTQNGISVLLNRLTSHVIRIF